MNKDQFDHDAFTSALRTRAIGRRLSYYSTVDSTMRLAREGYDAGGSHGSLFLSEEQTAGRGRQGRSFFSPAGENLYFTILLVGSADELRSVALAVPLAVCNAVRNEGVDASIKWPNDIWVDGLKLSGILIDAQGTGDELVVMPGIGINVNTDFRARDDLRDIATSIRSSLGKEVSRERLLASVCNNLERLLSVAGIDIAAEYRESSLVLGRTVIVSPRSGPPFEGLAEEIRTDGELLIRKADGTTVPVQAADVSLRPSNVGVDPTP